MFQNIHNTRNLLYPSSSMPKLGISKLLIVFEIHEFSITTKIFSFKNPSLCMNYMI